MQGQSFDIPLQRINDHLISASGVNLYVLRTDLNHSHISGNKLYKLKYNLEEAQKQNQKTILTFGGAFSNHIAAAAAAGRENGFKTIGIIRGELVPELNPTLKFAQSQGMQLHFISREEYKNKHEPSFIDSLHEKFGDFFMIPEGGANKAGIEGCKEITQSITIPFDYVCCPCGTGTTLAGIILSLKEAQEAIGLQVLKGENYIHSEVTSWLRHFNSEQRNWSVNTGYHFGGYAKCTAELREFISAFEASNVIPLDPVYTAKMMYGIYDLISKGFFKAGQTIVAVHTGGLQGNAGFYET